MNIIRPLVSLIAAPTQAIGAPPVGNRVLMGVKP